MHRSSQRKSQTHPRPNQEIADINPTMAHRRAVDDFRSNTDIDASGISITLSDDGQSILDTPGIQRCTPTIGWDDRKVSDIGLHTNRILDVGYHGKNSGESSDTSTRGFFRDDYPSILPSWTGWHKVSHPFLVFCDHFFHPPFHIKQREIRRQYMGTHLLWEAVLGQ